MSTNWKVELTSELNVYLSIYLCDSRDRTSLIDITCLSLVISSSSFTFKPTVWLSVHSQFNRWLNPRCKVQDGSLIIDHLPALLRFFSSSSFTLHFIDFTLQHRKSNTTTLSPTSSPRSLAAAPASAGSHVPIGCGAVVESKGWAAAVVLFIYKIIKKQKLHLHDLSLLMFVILFYIFEEVLGKSLFKSKLSLSILT